MSSVTHQIGIKLSASGAEAVSSSFDKISSVAKTVGATIGAAFTVKQFTDWMQGAINAGDEMKAFSQKTGIAVQEVAGLQLAFKQGGVEGDALTSSLGKMAKQMVEGNDAFDKLGVKTRNADGSLRDVKEVLYDVADATVEMGAGAEKSAVLQEIFGKSAADLIPTLAEGSEGLLRMADMADVLGLSMSSEAADAADQFNDTVELLGMGLQGVARQTMQQLLPTLSNLSGVFLETATSGDYVAKASEVIASGLKLLASGGIIVTEVFSSVGKVIGATAAGVMAMMSGDFKGAFEIGKQAVSDLKEGSSSAASTISKVWEKSSSVVVDSLAKEAGEKKRSAVLTKEQEEANKKAAAAATQHAKELDKLAASMRAESAGLSGDFFDKWDKLVELKKAGKISTEELEAAQARLLKQQPYMVEAAKAETAAIAAKNKALDELFDTEEKARLKNEGQIKSAREMLESIQFETAALKMNATEREIATAMRALEKDGVIAGTQAYDNLAESIRGAIVNREAVKAGVDAQRAATDSIKRMNDEIGQSLTDSLFRAFESGKGFFKTLWDGIRNTLKTTVLKVLMQPVQAGMTSAVGSLLGTMSGGANAAGAGSGLLGNLGGIGSMLGSGLGAFGSGFGMAMNGGMGLALEGGMSMLGSASGLSSAMAGIGQIAGALGPIALGIGAVYAIAKSLDHSGTPHIGGSATADAQGARTVANDGWFNQQRNSDTEDLMLGTAKGAANILNSLARVAGGGNFAVTTAYADDSSKDPGQGQLRIQRDGKTITDWGSNWSRLFSDGESGVKQYLQAVSTSTREAIDSIGLPEWAADTLQALGGSPTLEQLAVAADQIVATSAAISSVRDAFAPLGGVFSRISELSDDAKIKLIGFSGGIEALLSNVSQYVSDFYSTDERNAITAASINKALEDAGITTDFSSKTDWRATVDGWTDMSDNGLKQLAVLLDVSNSFAGIADYLKEQGTTLDQLAASAPQNALVNSLTNNSQTQADLATQQLDQLTLLTETADAQKQELGGIRAALGEAIAAMLSVAANTAATASTLRDLDTGEGLRISMEPQP